MISLRRLREVLYYSPRTGKFRWLERASNRISVGDTAGTTRDGYVFVKVDGTIYKAHRLAFFYMVGYWPSSMLDHRNEVKSDNRWSNLREATRSQNGQNISKARSDSSSGCRGVSWYKKYGTWEARIKAEGSYLFLGRFKTKEEANAAYLQAKAIHHPLSLAAA